MNIGKTEALITEIITQVLNVTHRNIIVITPTLDVARLLQKALTNRAFKEHHLQYQQTLGRVNFHQKGVEVHFRHAIDPGLLGCKGFFHISEDVPMNDIIRSLILTNTTSNNSDPKSLNDSSSNEQKCNLT